MALKQIMLSNKINKKRTELAALIEKDSEFSVREAELETSISEASTEEEQAAVEAAIDQFEADKAKHEEDKAKLQGEINDLEAELDEAEKESAPAEDNKNKERNKERMNRRKFFNLSPQERDEFFSNEKVKAFLERVREIGLEKRSVKGADLTIPDVVLDLIRENIMDYSKLVRRVSLRPVSGTARQNVMGTIPEAVWTEMCARLNEIDFGFTQAEVDGYKVGGVIYICKATLEDSEYDLASEIINALGIAIGIALDKAILYGFGTKMPLGIVTRLAQTLAPSDYPANERPWADLHESNMITIDSSKTGIEFYKAIVEAGGKAKNNYARGVKFWAMNETTYTKLKLEAINFNAAGAIVSVQDGTMPVAGGDIIVLSNTIIPDNNIVAGYGELYLLAERQGSEFARSDDYRFAEDQVAFKGTARYDGLPVIAEAFIAIGIGAAPTSSVTFAGDTANDASLQDLSIGDETLAHTFNSTTYAYTVTATGTEGEVNAIPAQDGAKVKLTYDGKEINNGQTVKFTGTKNLVIEVTNGLGKQSYTVAITKS